MTNRRWEWPISAGNVLFASVTFFFVLIAHAAAYLTHEYAHALVAWSLGWMSKPFGIDYGPATVYNFVFLGDVSDNVNYGPIFAAGHGIEATAIALAGPFLGNGLLYFIIYALTSGSWVKSKRYLLTFLYWLSLMCAANVWSYVPIRSLTTHADIALAAKGLGISTWALFPFVLIPSLFVTFHFMTRMFPSTYQRITADSPVNLALFIAFTGFWYFSFFGGGGIDGSYGFISQMLSILSSYLLFPLCVAYLSSRWAVSVREIKS